MAKILKATSNAEILSFIINQNPELASEIDLPVQGESVKPIGKLIMDNERYKNAFINTVNLIGLTVIKENRWNNPWQDFTDKGMLRFGQQIREIIQDLAHVFDYNENYSNKTKFVETAVPDVYNYIHDINFQKVWETTVNESQLLMAFDDEENGLYRFIEETISNLYETYDYDKWLVDKYQLCRRMLDGTMTPVKITASDPRDILASMKAISNKMTFKSPNYNPAGVRRATKHSDQFLMLDAEREAITSTNVLATSYFLNEAETKTNLALIDSFSETDESRLIELLGDAYIPFTDDEKTALSSVLGLIVARDFFMDYNRALDTNPDVYGKRQTEFVNPTTLDRNVFLHAQAVISTSPFANGCVFTTVTPAVESVTISPSVATINRGQSLKLSSVVETSGFANKAVTWKVDDTSKADGVKIDLATGELEVPYSTSVSSITVTATSVFDSTKTATATVNIAGLSITPSTSADLYGKSASDLQENISIVNNIVKGTSKYVTGYTGFSGEVSEQSGNYVALHLSATSGDITIQTSGGLNDSRIVTIPYTGDDLVVKVVSREEKLFITNNNVTREIKLTDLTLASE